MTVSDEPIPYVDDNDLRLALVFLLGYKEFTLASRSFMLNDHQRELADIQAGTGAYVDLPTTTRQFLEARLYLEMVERITMLVEDLAGMTSALLDLPRVLEELINAPSSEPGRVLQRLDSTAWSMLMRYRPLDEFDLAEDDLAFVQGIRDRQVARCQDITQLAIEFSDLYWPVFLKHKHGNPLIYGLRPIDIDGEPTFSINALYNRRQPRQTKGALLSQTSYEKLGVLFNALLFLLFQLVERTIDFMRQDGIGLLEGQKLLFPLTEGYLARLQRIADRTSVGARDINATMRVEIEPSAIERHRRFMSRLDEATKRWAAPADRPGL